jgi:quercetin dioxygenase-like cupin family protein
MNTPSFKILLLILVCGLAPATWADQHAGQMTSVDPQTAKYMTPAGMPACAKMSVLNGDPAKGPSLILGKLATGCTVPWHWHTPAETLMVVSGAGKLEMRDGKPIAFKPGEYLSMPSHHVHQAHCSSACVMFISADAAFDIHYVDDKGHEIPAAAALKKAPKKKAG